MMKASLGVGAMFPRKIDLTSEWNLKAGYFHQSQTHLTPFPPPPPPPPPPPSPPPPPLSFLCALYCVVPTAEIIMDIGNL